MHDISSRLLFWQVGRGQYRFVTLRSAAAVWQHGRRIFPGCVTVALSDRKDNRDRENKDRIIEHRGRKAKTLFARNSARLLPPGPGISKPGGSG